MRLSKTLVAGLLAPLLLTLSHSAEEKTTAVSSNKPSLTYYYFDG
jgi:hypothetical protein